MVKGTVVGKKIIEVRNMTRKEAKSEGWKQVTTTLVLEDGTKIYPSVDKEGNRAGVLLGAEKDGRKIWIYNEKLKKAV